MSVPFGTSSHVGLFERHTSGWMPHTYLETAHMQKTSLDAPAREQPERAASTPSGRTSPAEHENPGEATLLVLRGRVRQSSSPARHALQAIDDAAVLLTVAQPG